jgi:hypothetical protein
MPDGSPRRGSRWRLVPYIQDTGKSSVMDFLDSLREQSPKVYEEFHQVVKPQFEEHGPIDVGPPRWEGLGGGLAEIRWFGSHRLYCSIESGRRVMLYMGVVKYWRIFKREHRRFCDTARADVLSGAYDEKARERKYRALRDKRGKNGLA